MIGDILNRIAGMVKRAYVTLVGDDSGRYQTTQIGYLGKTADMEVIYPYGLCGNPPKNSLVLLFNVQGMEENRAGIANLLSERFKNLKEGEVAIGNYLTKSVIKFLENGDIEIHGTNDERVTIDRNCNININGNCDISVNGTTTLSCPGGTTINSDVHVNGTVTISEDVIASGISLVSHIHGGVTPGGGTTSGPI
jgi:hypothetical protein